MKKFTSTEVIEIIYTLSINWATGAVKDILKDVIIEVENTDDEKKKLAFDLSIAFISVASHNVYNMIKWDKNFQKTIMDGVCDLYFASLHEFSKDDPIKNDVDATFFVRDTNEREILRKDFQRVTGKKCERDELFRTSLYGLACWLFNKRFLEYQELLQLDWRNMLAKQQGFLPQMPHKVYEHYSGKSGEGSRTPESLMFAIRLFTCFTNFSLELSKLFSEITVDNG